MKGYFLFLFLIIGIQSYQISKPWIACGRYCRGNSYWQGVVVQPHQQTSAKNLFQLHARVSVFETSELVLDDFDEILEAIGIFNQVYGDYDIPNKFEVPAEAPWPVHLHGLRLGKRLEKILSSKEFYKFYPDKAQALKEHGFNPVGDVVIDDWSTIIAALKVYKEVYGDIRVPAKYEVPDTEPWPRLARGLRLGTRVAAIRSAGRYVRDRPDRKAELDLLGFEWRLRDGSARQQFESDLFELVCDALRIYKQVEDSSLLVPPDFIVPAVAPWPDDIHDLPLGQYVNLIRKEDKFLTGFPQRRMLLSELGFQWEESSRAALSKKRFEIIYEALKVYKDMYGDVLVPLSFVVPSSPPWPPSTYGVKLGTRVQSIRLQGTFVGNSQERRDMLTRLGFDWDYDDRRKRSSSSKVNELDRVGDYDNQVDDLDQGLELSSSLMLSGDEDPSSAYDAFSSLSSMDIPYDDDIDMCTSIFTPSEYTEVIATAMNHHILSKEVSDKPEVRELSHFEGYMSPFTLSQSLARYIPPNELAEMKERGYRYIEFERFSWEHVVEALLAYKSTFGDVNVPSHFVINDQVLRNYPKFHEILEYMPLGRFVERLRCGDIEGYEDPSRREFLDALGFDWGDRSTYLHFPFEPFLFAVRVYNHLYGFILPLEDFVIPDEPQWPVWMAGIPLGEWVVICRIQQQLIERHYPDRKEILDDLDFLWWIPPSPTMLKKFENIL
eukprot:gene3929-4293_t